MPGKVDSWNKCVKLPNTGKHASSFRNEWQETEKLLKNKQTTDMHSVHPQRSTPFSSPCSDVQQSLEDV